MKAEQFTDKLFELLGVMHDDLQEHKCASVEDYNQQITKLFEQSAAVKRALLEHGKMAMKGMKIDPPPKDNSQEPLYRVVYTIDVNAKNAYQAAEHTHRIMTDPDSMRPVLHIVDSNGVHTKVDLSEDNANLENSAEMANYDAAAQYLADHGREIFTGHMIGGLWNGRCMDACIMSKKQGDKAAYEFLLKFGDQYASSLSGEQQHQWQSIKNKSASILKSGKDSKCDKFTKITVGFVTQAFEKNDKGKFVCNHQEFIAGDQCDYEDAEGNPITPPEHPYQQFNMSL